MRSGMRDRPCLTARRSSKSGDELLHVRDCVLATAVETPRGGVGRGSRSRRAACREKKGNIGVMGNEAAPYKILNVSKLDQSVRQRIYILRHGSEHHLLVGLEPCSS